jgi:hypothetical protein
MIARMRVPKMVKNGLNSSFGVWGPFRGAHLFCGRDLTKGLCFLPSLSRSKIRLSNKPMLDPNGQKKNKNHFRPISEQTYALKTTDFLEIRGS